MFFALAICHLCLRLLVSNIVCMMWQGIMLMLLPQVAVAYLKYCLHDVARCNVDAAATGCFFKMLMLGQQQSYCVPACFLSAASTVTQFMTLPLPIWQAEFFIHYVQSNAVVPPSAGWLFCFVLWQCHNALVQRHNVDDASMLSWPLQTLALLQCLVQCAGCLVFVGIGAAGLGHVMPPATAKGF